MKPPFVIFALPRSRTYWLSQFLSYRDWTCSHEEARHIRSVDDVKSWLSQERAGTVETAAAPFWRLLSLARSGVTVITIRRPVDEVVDSLMATGILFDHSELISRIARLDHKLDQIEARVPNVLSVQFADLAKEETCAKIFTHCLPYAHDRARWEMFAPAKMQINLPALLDYGRAYSSQLRKAESVCKQAMKQKIWQGKRGPDVNGVVIDEEPFEQFWRDGQHLFSDHCIDVGESEDQWMRKNLPLIEKLSAVGAVQIMTARSNGRMFGYLASILGPSLEDKNLNVATQTSFYASHDARGLNLGLKLQRASVAALSARGGRWEVISRAGVRGSGPRMEALYRRMGAEDCGHLFKTSLEAA